MSAKKLMTETRASETEIEFQSRAAIRFGFVVRSLMNAAFAADPVAYLVRLRSSPVDGVVLRPDTNVVQFQLTGDDGTSLSGLLNAQLTLAGDNQQSANPQLLLRSVTVSADVGGRAMSIDSMVLDCFDAEELESGLTAVLAGQPLPPVLKRKIVAFAAG